MNAISMRPADGEPVDDTLHALARASLFSSLARALAYPTAMSAAEAHASLLARLGAPVPLQERVREALLDAAQALAAPDVDGLGAEHVRLFGPAGPAPLHETAYGDAGRMLGRASQLADISGFYLAYGLEPSTRAPLPEDHLQLELEFASILALKEAYARNEELDEALAITVDTQRKFLAEHLGTWLPAWRAALERAGADRFYGQLASTIRDVVASECARLEVIPHVVTNRIVDPDVGGDEVACPRAVTGPE